MARRPSRTMSILPIGCVPAPPYCTGFNFAHEGFIQRHPRSGRVLDYVSFWDSGLRIVDVTSSAGEGVIRWGPHEVCLTAERAGQETSGRIYDIKVEATDSHGNVVSHIVHVTIPHGQPQGCLKTQRLPTCS